jgi:hypothetical protein
MKLSRVAFALVVALCVPQAVLAWNATGHELVAGIAWDNMTVAARQKAIALLNSAPSDACLLNLMATDARPKAEREREFFMRVATWPDLVWPAKVDARPCTRFADSDAHFEDHFWQGVSGTTGSSAPQDRPDIAGKPDNAIVRLNAVRDSVACAAGPCETDVQRATDLPWILHLVGDIHQPLHTAARVSAEHPTGDQGGNGFLLSSDPKGPKLHSFWDDIVDKSIPLNTGEANQKSITYLDRVIARITADHPRSSMINRLTPVDFEAWSQEGFATAKRAAYPASLHEGQMPSAAYRAAVFKVGDEAIALGGYRLADLLNTMLDRQGVVPPPPPPGPSNHLPAPSHIVIVIDENKKFGDVIGAAPKAPFINGLAARGALLNVFALHHPSQPNYMELFAGQLLGVCADECRIGPFTAQNLGAALIAAGKTFVGFAENLPAQPRLACSGLFRAKHAPWVDFSNIPASASKDFATDFPTTPAGFNQLPDVSFVIPNMINDMHNGNGIAAQVATGNNWLRNNLSAYADWAVTHNSLLIVTWDEDSKPSVPTCPSHVITTTPPDNHIATIIMGEPVRSGQTPSDQYTHHDLLRTILDMYGIAPFAGATTAKDITGIWK